MVGILLAVVVLLGLPAFSLHPSIGKEVVVVEMASGDLVKFKVDVVSTLEDQARGLQGVDSLRSNQGMWFEYDYPREMAFWMKDTLMSLDILFVNSDREIMTIHASVPTCKEVDPSQENCPNYLSGGGAQFVLEIPGGEAMAQGIQVGDIIR